MFSLRSTLRVPRFCFHSRPDRGSPLGERRKRPEVSGGVRTGTSGRTQESRPTHRKREGRGEDRSVEEGLRLGESSWDVNDGWFWGSDPYRRFRSTWPFALWRCPRPQPYTVETPGTKTSDVWGTPPDIPVPSAPSRSRTGADSRRSYTVTRPHWSVPNRSSVLLRRVSVPTGPLHRGEGSTLLSPPFPTTLPGSKWEPPVEPRYTSGLASPPDLYSNPYRLGFFPS